MLRLNSKVDRPDFNYLFRVLQDSMELGIKIDVSSQLMQDLNNEMITANLVMKQYGLTKPNSPRAVISILKELSKSDPLIKKYCYNEKDDKWTSNERALKPLVHNNNQFAIDLLYYRKVAKYISYLSGLQDSLDSNSYAHPTICGSSTNRVQYREPGILTIPKQVLWNVIKPRSSEWSLYSIDIKNQEPWILINMLNITELKELLAIAGSSSLYDMLFILIYKKQPTPLERKEFKRAWNAFTYGASKKGVASICFNIDSEAIHNYFNKLTAYKNYKSQMYARANSGANKSTTLFGTTLIANGSTKNKIAKQLMDMGIQGTGADILAFLVKHFDSEVSRIGLSDKMHIYFTRHDECIIEVSKTLENEIGEYGVCGLLGDIFEHQIDDWEPFKMEISPIEDTIVGLFDDVEDCEDYDDD